MSLELMEFQVDGEAYEGRLNVQDEDADEGVVILPGAGHGPFGDIFDIVAYELAGASKQVLRFESWENHEELNERTLAGLHEEVDAAVEWLQSNGCSTVHVLAKSFGGGVALARVPDGVEGMVLWAPAANVGIDPADATAVDDELGEIDGFAIHIANLDHVDVPLRILRGTEDKGVSLDDCRRIVDAVEDGEVTEVPGENHSFNENRTFVVEKTLEYLATDA